MCLPPLAKPEAGVALHLIEKLKKKGAILSPKPMFYSKPVSQVALQTTSEPACLGPALLAMSERSHCPLSAATLGVAVCWMKESQLHKPSSLPTILHESGKCPCALSCSGV